MRCGTRVCWHSEEAGEEMKEMSPLPPNPEEDEDEDEENVNVEFGKFD